MQTEELIHFLSKFNSIKQNFQGVYSITTIPILKLNHFIIVNTDPHYNPGKHWFCLVRRKKYFELFDSLGVTEEKLEYLKEFINFRKRITFKYNETPLQSNNSISCGQFVLYFIVQRFHNLDLSFQDILDEIFEASIDINETLVQHFFNEFSQ